MGRKDQLGFLFVLLTASSLFVLTFVVPQVPRALPLTTNRSTSELGSREGGTTARLMPANTLVTISFVTNHTISAFLTATVTVFSYKISPGTILKMALYLNGQLEATRDYDLYNSYNAAKGARPANLTQTIAPELATFTNSALAPNVSLMDMGSTTFPSGTIVTVNAWANQPIWVQIDTAPLTHSFETSGLSTFSPSPVLTTEGVMSPYTIAVGLETN